MLWFREFKDLVHGQQLERELDENEASQIPKPAYLSCCINLPLWIQTNKIGLYWNEKYEREKELKITSDA